MKDLPARTACRNMHVSSPAYFASAQTKWCEKLCEISCDRKAYLEKAKTHFVYSRNNLSLIEEARTCRMRGKNMGDEKEKSKILTV